MKWDDKIQGTWRIDFGGDMSVRLEIPKPTRVAIVVACAWGTGSIFNVPIIEPEEMFCIRSSDQNVIKLIHVAQAAGSAL